MTIKHRIDLHTLIPDIATAHVAELGCAEGYHSADMLRWGIERLYMVDLWKSATEVPGDASFGDDWHERNYQEAMKRIAPWKDRVTVLRGYTHQMASLVPDGSLALLYLDACHDYLWFLRDLKVWTPKVKHGGVIAGHDFLNPAYGVNRAVHEFATNVRTIEENKPVDAGFWFFKEDVIA